MKILTIDLQNICAVERMTVDFTGNNMVVLVGQNGCGKSTLIGFIYWQLTGKLPDAHPTKDDFRRILGKETPTPSGGVGTYEIGGHEVVLETWLHTRNWKMTVDGTLVATTPTTVAAELAKMLRLEVKIIRQYGFIQQGTMRSVLFGQHAQRMEAFSKLIGADTAEPAREKIRLVVNAIESPDLSDEILAARESLSRVTDQVSETEKKRDSASHVINGIDVDADRLIMSRWEEGIAAEAKLKQIVTQLEAAQDELSKAKDSEKEAAKNAEGWKVCKDARESPASKARDSLAAHESNNLQYNHFVEVLSAFTTLNRVVFQPLVEAPIPEREELPPEPKKPERLDEARSKLDALSANAHNRSEALDAYSSKGVGVCQVCGEKCACCEASNGGPADPERVKELTRLKDAAWTSYDNAKTLIETYERDCARWRSDTDAANRAYEAQVRDIQTLNNLSRSSRETELLIHNNNLDRVTKELEQCVVRDKPLLDITLLNQNIDLFTEAVEQHQHWAATLTARASMRNLLHTRLTALMTEKAALSAATSGAPSLAEKEGARTRVTLHQVHLSAYNAIVDSLKGLAPLAESQKKGLEDLMARQTRNLKLRKFKALLESMRAVLHRDRLPARVIAGYMQLLVARINEHLPKFGAEFLIFTDGTEFMVRKAMDGTEIAASNLSGGEACRWCISFLLAVHQLFASDLGLLVLDEPSDGLDEAGQEAFGEAMVQLQDILRDTHTQTLIATHSEPISAGAERVINVKELVEAS